MSKQKFEAAIQRELEKLNNKIDYKIIRGISYVNEARRHKFLLENLSATTREAPRPVYGRRLARSKWRPSPLQWFGRSISALSSFLL